jgi:hypothetical protein
MLEKLAGVCLVKKLHAIQLYKADFNCYNQFIFDKQAMQTLMESGYILEELFSQKGSTAEDAKHQKQHYVPYYLSIVFFLYLKYAFGIISMIFTLVRCSIILSRLFLTYLHPCFAPYVQIYQISVRLLMSHAKCPIWQVLFIIKFGTFAFFFCIVPYSLQVHNVQLQTSKMSHPFFPFCLILLVSTI